MSKILSKSLLTLLVVGGLDGAKYQEAFVPDGQKLDEAFFIQAVPLDIALMQLTLCAAKCKMLRACYYFTISQGSCQMYHRAHLLPDADSVASSYYEIHAVLMLRHDISDGQLFPTFAGSWALNKHNEDSKLFSRLDKLDNYLGEDGKYHLKLCYKELELGDNCYYFKQDADPRSPPVGLVASGFELLSHPPGHPSAGDSQSLALSGISADTNAAWLDGNNDVNNYWFALGSTVLYSEKIPAIHSSPTLQLATHVELYILDM